MNKPKVDGERLWTSLRDRGRVGATPGGGSGRLALTDLDREARDLCVDWCRGAGCAVRIDRMGNIFARRAGADAAVLGPVFASASHPAAPSLGASRFAALVRASPLPVYALGGIDAAAAQVVVKPDPLAESCDGVWDPSETDALIARCPQSIV